MLMPATVTRFAAARGNQILSDGYDTPDLAKQQAQHLNEQMSALGLEPDITVVSVTVTTKLGRVTAYRDHVEVDMVAAVGEVNTSPSAAEG